MNIKTQKALREFGEVSRRIDEDLKQITAKISRLKRDKERLAGIILEILE